MSNNSLKCKTPKIYSNEFINSLLNQRNTVIKFYIDNYNCFLYKLFGKYLLDEEYLELENMMLSEIEINDKININNIYNILKALKTNVSRIANKEKLFQIPLFRDLPLNIKESLLDKLDFVIYAADKKEIVVTQGTPCNKLYVLLEGKLRTDIIDGLGNEVMIEYIIAPRTFATPHLFNSNNTLPATFTALEDSVVLMATKDSTFKVISQDPQVLHNFLCIAGNCNICTVSRLKPLSRKTVRERFIVYLFEHKKTDSLTVEIMHTQSQLAEYLNVSRPALSKEINKIIKEGLITMEGKKIEILNKMALEKYL